MVHRAPRASGIRSVCDRGTRGALCLLVSIEDRVYTGSVSDLFSFHKSTRAFVVFSFVLPMAYATSPPPISAIA